MGDKHKVWKARIAFQGSNVRTKSGTSAADFFEETANAPASFAAARGALASNALARFFETRRRHTFRLSSTRQPEFPLSWSSRESGGQIRGSEVAPVAKTRFMSDVTAG